MLRKNQFYSYNTSYFSKVDVNRKHVKLFSEKRNFEKKLFVETLQNITTMGSFRKTTLKTMESTVVQESYVMKYINI